MKNFVSNGMRIFARKFSLALMVLVLTNLTMGGATTANAGVYAIAKKYVGLHEKKHTARIKKTFGVNPRRTPWCGAFVGTVAKKAGKQVPPGHLRAASWRKVGKGVSLSKARKGDIVVIRTKRGNHVGIYVGKSGGKVQLLGGNQSNQVKVSNYRVGSVVSVRRL